MLSNLAMALMRKAKPAAEPEADMRKMGMHAAARHLMDGIKKDDHEQVAEALHHFHTIAADAPEQAYGDGDPE